MGRYNGLLLYNEIKTLLNSINCSSLKYYNIYIFLLQKCICWVVIFSKQYSFPKTLCFCFEISENSMRVTFSQIHNLPQMYCYIKNGGIQNQSGSRPQNISRVFFNGPSWISVRIIRASVVCCSRFKHRVWFHMAPK